MKNDLHLVCPHCQSINRVPTAKLSEHPNCGRCQQPLFTGEPRELTGVLGHEIAHIANEDLRVMGLADSISRLTHLLALLGQIMLLFSLPALLWGTVAIQSVSYTHLTLPTTPYV